MNIPAADFRRRMYAELSEDAIQADIVVHLRLILPGSHRVFHVPNGGSRDAREAAKLKRMGVLPGIPDIAILRPAQRVAWIEVKAAKGRLSSAQIAFRDWCRAQGHPWALCRSVSDAEAFVHAEGMPVTRYGRAAK